MQYSASGSQNLLSSTSTNRYGVNIQANETGQVHCDNKKQHSDEITTDNCTYTINNNNENNQEPRPFQLALRLLGVWQPVNSSIFFHIYNNMICLVLWVAVMFAIIGVNFFDHFKYGKLLNAIGTLFNLGAPFLITRYYFQHGKFDRLLGNIRRSCSQSPEQDNFQHLRLIYTFISLLSWALGFAFFYYHFIPYFTKTYHYILYAFVLFYSLGWWATWLGIYGYVCGCHKTQIREFIRSMKSLYGYSTRTKPAEEQCLSKLLKEFTELRSPLQQSQRNFSKIISFCVIYHVFDITVFSIAYWSHDFLNYPIWQYVGGITFDVVSILLKLYPAAIVNQELREVVVTAGTFCSPCGNSGRIPAERLAFHQYLFLREQDLGMNILGVKITSQVTVSILATLSILGLAFLYYAVPLLADGAVPM